MDKKSKEQDLKNFITAMKGYDFTNDMEALKENDGNLDPVKFAKGMIEYYSLIYYADPDNLDESSSTILGLYYLKGTLKKDVLYGSKSYFQGHKIGFNFIYPLFIHFKSLIK